MKGYKGFDKDFCCSGNGSSSLRYKVGETVTHDGVLALCKAGLHFVLHPLDVLRYYPAAGSRFAIVEADGVSDETHLDDSKRVAKSIKVEAEISLADLTLAAVKFVFEKVDWSKAEDKATGYGGAASATGVRGAAFASGWEGKAMAAKGGWITVAEWRQDKTGTWQRHDVKTARVDGKRIKADTFYRLKRGKFVEAPAS